MSNTSGLKSVLTNTAYLVAARIITIIARLVYIIAIARMLGPELYGSFNYGLSWYLLFVPISVWGLDFILIREIGRQSDISNHILRTSLALRGLSNVFVAFICLILGWILEEDNLLRQLLFIFCFALLGRGLSSWVNAVLKGFEKSQFVFYQEVIFRVLEVLVGVIFLFNGFGILTLAVVHSVSWLLQSVAGLYLIRRYIDINLKPIWDWIEINKLLHSGFYFLIAAFSLSWLMQGGVVLYRHIADVDIALGYLALAIQAYIIIGSVVAELGFAAIPVLSRSSDREDGKTGVFIEYVFKIGWLTSGGLVIITATIAPSLIPFLFGRDYSRVIELLPWSVALVGPLFWASSLRSVLTAHGLYKANALSALLGAMVFSIIFFPAVELYSLQGVFYATGAGLLVIVIFQIKPLIYKDAIDFKETIIAPAFVVSCSLACYYLLNSFSSVLALIAGLIILGVYAFMLLVVLRRNI